MSTLLDGAKIFADTEELSSDNSYVKIIGDRRPIVVGGIVKNEVEIYDNAFTDIPGNVSDDIIHVVESVEVTVHGEAGDDIIYAVNGENNILEGNSGNDIIYAEGSDYSSLDGNEGNDIIIANNSSGYSVSGGIGNDIIVLKDLQANSNYIIDNTEYDAMDRDILSLTQYYKNDFICYLDRNKNLKMFNYNGSVICVEGWNKHQLSRVAFKDGFFNEKMLLNKMVNYYNNSTTINGTSLDDVFIIDGAIDVILKTLGGNDTVLIESGSNDKVYLGSGTDSIYVMSADNLSIYGGSGSNTYNINAGNKNNVDITYSNTSSTLISTSNNLKINGLELNNINAYCDETDRLVINNDSSNVTVKNWNNGSKNKLYINEIDYYMKIGKEYVKEGSASMMNPKDLCGIEINSASIDKPAFICNNMVKVDNGYCTRVVGIDVYDVFDNNRTNLITSNYIELGSKLRSVDSVIGVCGSGIINYNSLNINAEMDKSFMGMHVDGVICYVGEANYNCLNVNQSSNVWDLCGVSVYEGNASYNKVNISRDVYVGSSITAASSRIGDVSNNELVAESCHLSSNTGGITDFGDANNNSVIISYDREGEFDSKIYGGRSSYGSANGNKVIINGHRSEWVRLVIIGGEVRYDNETYSSMVKDNVIYANELTTTDSFDSIIGGKASYTQNVTIENNAVFINNVTVWGTVIGGSVNSVSGGTNKVLNNSVIVSSGDIYRIMGGFGNGILTNNYVEMLGGTAKYVYGAFAEAGEAYGNRVILKGDAIVSKDLYTAQGYVTDNNSAFITENAFVNGCVYGSDGKDIIVAGSSKSVKVDGGAGDDVLYSLSVGNDIDGGAGSDTFVIDWENADGVNITDQVNGSDLNVIKIANVEASDVKISKNSAGSLLIINSNGATMTLNGWSTGAYSSINLLSDNSSVVYSKSAIENALSLIGSSELKFTDDSLAVYAQTNALTDDDKEQLLKVAGNY